MKQHVAILSLLILFLSSSFFAYAQEEFQNQSFGYSINIPKEYAVSQSLNNVITITSEKKNDSNGIDSISVLVTAHDDKPFSEMVQLVKNDIENFGNKITDEVQFDLGADNNVVDDIGNNQKNTVMIRSYVTDIGVPVFFENIVAYHDNLAYFITITYTDESTHNDFHTMLYTFEFAQDDFIPEWIRTVSERWSDDDSNNEKQNGTVSDEDFAFALGYVLSDDLIQDIIALEENVHNNTIPQNNNNDDDDDKSKTVVILPSWLKHPTSSWVNGDIDNATWKNLIEYLYEKEIIVL